jgi:hypothetical protein
MARLWRREVDPHDDPRIVEALSILDALDAKASGLGSILGLTFATNMVLAGALEAGRGLPSIVLALSLAGLGVQLLAITLVTSCLVLMDARARDLMPRPDEDMAEEAVQHFAQVSHKRTQRYRLALWLTFASIALLALALFGFGLLKLAGS